MPVKKLSLFVFLTALSGSSLAQSVAPKSSETIDAKTRGAAPSIPGARVAARQSSGSLIRVRAGLGTAAAGVVATFSGDTGSAFAVQKSGTTGGN